MNIDQRNELLQQMLETEIGGVQVYETVWRLRIHRAAWWSDISAVRLWLP
jgi:hypothetical protein